MDLKEISRLEKVVINWSAGFKAAGLALKQLKEGGANGDTPWKIWVEAKFDMHWAKAYRLIKAAEVCEQLERLGFKNLPTHENQANVLRSLDDKELTKIWNLVGLKPKMASINRAKMKVLGGAIIAVSPSKKLCVQISQAEGIVKKVIDQISRLKVKDAKAVRERFDEMMASLKVSLKAAA